MSVIRYDQQARATSGRRWGLSVASACGVLVLALALACGGAPPASRWNLVDHFAAATLEVEPMLVDIGTPQGRAMLGRGWSHDEGSGDQSFVWGIGAQSTMDFYLAEPRALPLTFRCVPFRFDGAPVQALTFVLNGVGGPEVRLGVESEMAVYEVILPGAAARAGWNRLVVRYAYSRAPSEVSGTSDGRSLAVAWDYIRFGGERTTSEAGPSVVAVERSLLIPVGTGVGFALRLDSAAVLRFDGREAPTGAGATLVVSIEADGHPKERLARIEARSTLRAVDLPARLAGIVRVSLEAQGARGSDPVRLMEPRVESARHDLASPAPPLEPRHRRPNVVVYLVDTLRADALGCYGGSRPTSPHIDAFARDAVLFTDALTEAPWTRASVASLFTGLAVESHRVNGRTDALPEEAVTMAERFAQAGYETAAFVTNGNVASVYGFAQGFARYELLPGAEIPGPDGVVLQPLPNSADVTRRALAWLDGWDGVRPFLLYLHTADPHGPYQPPPEFRVRLGAPDDVSLGSLASLRLLHEGKRMVDDALVRSLRLLYDAEVAQNDAEVGKVVEGLRRRGLYDDTIVVLLADHGEEFHEHGGWEHGHTLHGELEHVPLLVKRAGGRDGGARVARTVQLADVLPTLLAEIGEAASVPVSGANLFGAFDEPSVAIAHLELDDHVGDAVVEGRWKLVAMTEGASLYDREADPTEQHDVADDHPVTLAYLRAHLAERKRSAPPALPRRAALVTDEVRRNLEALGYVR